MANIMLFYKNVTPINKTFHRSLKFNPSQDMSFAKDTHWVPLASDEYFQAALDYPILFMSAEDEQKKRHYTSIALVGLSNDVNNYITADKSWQRDTYIPAFIRRYPFVLAQIQDQKELSVCFDQQSGMFNDVTGIELFNSDGSISPFMEERINFLEHFKIGMERTAEFIDTLVKMDLLSQKSINVKNDKGLSAQLEDFWIVDEEKLHKLPAHQLAKLHKNGFLGRIFAHLLSMNNLLKVLSLKGASQAAANSAANSIEKKEKTNGQASSEKPKKGKNTLN
ncbi:SapC family protein [Bartonella schoenbuchensis]|uniref:SapC protein n=1 Tax=Bartonella schoenbuchensis (strain DSM 13525 / NCTC 13165 / R1) TaxID=687861 RepID=E6Z1Q4_BARSR|nr:SapC family protein [Bartonella schoenbuchensis]AQX31433.1 SapC protein [Bartonella schoenbuchensis R1]CBI83042.1 SapC-related protein [Bartonella schoenbuchensis R1]